MDFETVVRSYYDALRTGDPLDQFFATEPEPVKFGISESLYGAEAVVEALREQTRTTSDWSIESHRLRTETHESMGWFTDHVSMAWTDLDRDERIDWETRWSGTGLERAGEWRFVGMHVSVAADDLA